MVGGGPLKRSGSAREGSACEGSARNGASHRPLSCRRDEFALPRNEHYLNCAFMSPLHRDVEDAGLRGMRLKRNPAAIRAEDFFADCDRLRRDFARLVNAPLPERVAVIPSVSYGVATVARNLTIQSGQNLVLAHEQFPGNVYVWRRLAALEGASIRTVAPPASGARGSGWNTRILEAIDAETAVVSLGQVHWTDGTLFDLGTIGARAREVGAVFVVDGTQSVGAMPFDVVKLQPDALVCASYKWMLGPYSLGLAYLGPRFDDGLPLEETWIAREGSEDFGGLVNYRDGYQPGAVRYDVGERSNFILVPMALAGIRKLLEWTPQAIQEYCSRITRPLLREAAAQGFTMEGEGWRAPHLFGVRMPPGLEIESLVRLLRERRVHVSLRGSAVRISPNVYNDEEDVAALTEVIRDVSR